MTAAIVCAYLNQHTIGNSAALLSLIDQVHAKISGFAGYPLVPSVTDGAIGDAADADQISGAPPVPIEESVTDEYIVCLEDGKRFKSLKRHLRNAYGLSPDAYRQKWGLPQDYPMTAPSYTKIRSEMARASGLGRRE
jgi:predicted transcriptional regulator